MDFKSLSVRSRLILLVGTATVGILVLFGVLVRDMYAVYTAANFANVNTVPSVVSLASARVAAEEMRILTWQHLGRTDAAHIGELESRIASERAGLQKTLDQYQASLVADEQDGAGLRSDREALSAYDTLRERVLALSRAGKKDEARELLLDSQSIVTGLVKAMEKHEQYNIDIGTAASRSAEATRTRALVLSAAIVLFVLGALVFVGLKTIRWLLGTLGGEPNEVAGIAQAVAGGNLSSHVSLRPNDTTSLLATVAQMQSDLKVRIEKERAVAAENAGMVTAIDKAMAQIEFDLDGRIQTANSNFLQAIGYTLAEIQGQHHSMFVDSAEARSPAYRDFWSQLRAGEFQSGQFRRVGKNGRVVWLQSSYTPILDSSGKPFKVVKFATDVTAQLRTTEEVSAMAQAAAQGDLSRRISTEGKSGLLLSLSEAVNSMADSMAEVVGKIRSVVTGLRSGTEEISSGNTDLSRRTEEQAASLEQTASSMEEMTSTVKQTADNAAQANQLAIAARAQAEKGGNVVAEAVQAMEGINDASSKIADIIGVIDEIAFQTNLLALNAAVEAARAGEQGRGFAVVAAEVRSLASRSATAAKEIKALIEDSVVRVEHGRKLVGQSGQTLSQIVVAVKKASDIVAEIASASKEQASGIDQVNKAVTSLDQVTQQNAALIEETASAAQSLTEEAQTLDRMMAAYQIGGQAATRVAAVPGVDVTTSRSEGVAGMSVRGGSNVQRKAKQVRVVKSVSSQVSEASRDVGKATAAAGGAGGEWSEF